MGSRGNKKQEKLLHNTEGKKRKKSKVFLVFAGAVSCVVFYILIGVVYAAVLCSTGKLKISSDKIKGSGLTVIDKNENTYKTVFAGGDDWIPYDDIPKELVQMLPTHSGYVNGLCAYFGGKYDNSCTGVIVREAKINGVLEGSIGKSELVRQAVLLGKDSSEEELWELLWNTLYFGNGVYGLANASKAYESALFSHLTQQQMEDLKVIAEKALKDRQYPSDEMVNEKVAYCSQDSFCDGLIKKLIADFSKKGKSVDDAARELYFGNLKAYTSIDSDLQQIVTEKYNQRENFTTLRSGGYIQSAIVILDYSGAVRAVSGGNAGNTLYNRALSVERQIGSTIKPFSVYAPALEEKMITFSSIMEDEPILIQKDGSSILWPTNYDGLSGGTVTVTKALQESKNTVAVRVCRMLGEQNVYEFLRDRLLFTNLNAEIDNNLSALALGYLSEGITLDKLSSCYTMFGTGGVYEESWLYDKLCKDNGEMLLKSIHKNTQAVSEETAYIMNRLLVNNVMQPQALAKEAVLDGVEVGGKTGTVGVDDEIKCQYFIGITPEYIGAVWVGFDDEMEYLGLNNYFHAEVVWKNIFKNVPITKTNFDVTGNVVCRRYCTESGKLASQYCNETEAGWYSVLDLPDECIQCTE